MVKGSQSSEKENSAGQRCLQVSILASGSGRPVPDFQIPSCSVRPRSLRPRVPRPALLSLRFLPWQMRIRIIFNLLGFS